MFNTLLSLLLFVLWGFYRLSRVANCTFKRVFSKVVKVVNFDDS